MKNNVRLLTLTLALLLLLSAVPFAAFADVSPRGEEHPHEYEETSSYSTYEWVSNTQHKKTTYVVKTCFCGDTVTTARPSTNEAHYAVTGSKTYLGTYIGENERAYDLYQLTCRHCGRTYQIKEWQEIID